MPGPMVCTGQRAPGGVLSRPGEELCWGDFAAGDRQGAGGRVTQGRNAAGPLGPAHSRDLQAHTHAAGPIGASFHGIETILPVLVQKYSKIASINSL